MKYGVLAGALVGIFFLIGYLVLSSMTMCGCGEEKLTVQLMSPEISKRTSEEEVVWDATLSINKVTPKDEKARWIKVTVAVKHRDGRILNEQTQLRLYDPSMIIEGGVDNDDVQLWFEDGNGDGKVSPGDNILVTGMDAVQYEGAHVHLMKDGKIIGYVELPTVFP